MDDSSKPFGYWEYQEFIYSEAKKRYFGEYFRRDILISLLIGLMASIFSYSYRKETGVIVDFLILVVVTIITYAVIISFYSAWEKVNQYNDQKKTISGLLPVEADIEISSSGFSPIPGKQMIKVVNHSASNIKCRATFSYIAPMMLPNQFPYRLPQEWYSKKLVWGSQNCPDGNILIDKNDGIAMLELAKVNNQGYKFLFQNGNEIQEGFDGSLPENNIGESSHMVEIRFDGEINKHEFCEKRKYLVSFALQKVDERDGKDIFIPNFEFKELFPIENGV